jgi:N-acetylmuramate 1-kinase
MQHTSSTPGVWRLPNRDETSMVRIAQTLALSLKAGDTIALSGDLGAGKTTFARALIRAFAGDDTIEVVSPTFSLVQTYDCDRGGIEHFDLYRLKGPEDVEQIGLGDEGSGVIRIIEWPDRLGEARAGNRLDIIFSETGSDATRSLELVPAGTMVARLDRLRSIVDFLDSSGWSNAAIAYLQGDASTRRYARLRRGSDNVILMDSPRQQDGPIVRDGKPYSQIAHLAEDVKPFVAVDHALRSAGLSAPEILAQDLDAGLLLIEDLGDRVYGREADGGAHQAELWTAAIDTLATFRRANLPMSMPVVPGDPPAGTHTLAPLDATILGIEVALLPDWYWPEVHGSLIPADIRQEFENLWQPVIASLLAQPRGWILRDFHSPNLLWLPERHGVTRVGVIDFQDAIAGPWAHDVMSLLQDARVDVPAEMEATLLARYISQMSGHPGFDEASFKAAYAAYGALRATRVLGLFVRLLRRDDKPDYLRHIKRNWGYLERNLQHPGLRQLASWYDRYFPAGLRSRSIVP